MQIKLMPRTALAVGVAVISLTLWLARSDTKLEAAAQDKTPRPISVTLGVNPKQAVETGDVLQICRLNAARELEPLRDSAATRVKASSDASQVAIYAVRLPDGVAVCAANTGDAPASIKLGIRLTRGAYSLERSLLAQNSGQGGKTPLPQNWGPGGETSAQIERLQSVYMDRAGWLWRSGRLEPNQAAVYRFTNRSALVQSSYDSLAAAMRNLRKAQPHDYRLLASAVRICEDNVAALANGTRKPDRFRMLRYIHRALLAVGQAQSFSRNAAGQREMQESLDRFEDSLANLSAAILTLVPSLDVASGTDSQAREVTVKLTNCGEKSIENLRMGIQTPQGGRVWPGDRAMFSSLKPGESARATFSVRFPEADANPRIGAEITYFIANAPARLHVETGL